MKKRRGRPLLGKTPMRRVQVRLDETTVRRARDLGQGNVSAGLRQAVKAAWEQNRNRGYDDARKEEC